MIENFLTTEQVANILQVHPFTILKLLKEGKLKGIKLGRVYRIKESDIQEFLEGRSINNGKSHNHSAPKEEDRTPEIVKEENYRIEKSEKRGEGPTHYII